MESSNSTQPLDPDNYFDYMEGSSTPRSLNSVGKPALGADKDDVLPAKVPANAAKGSSDALKSRVLTLFYEDSFLSFSFLAFDWRKVVSSAIPNTFHRAYHTEW